MSPEESIAMDILDSFPPGTDLQRLYKDAHMRVPGSEKRWRVKAEIHVLINRRKGIECSYLDFLDEDFEIESLRDLIEIRIVTRKRYEEKMKELDARWRKLIRKHMLKPNKE